MKKLRCTVIQCDQPFSKIMEFHLHTLWFSTSIWVPTDHLHLHLVITGINLTSNYLQQIVSIFPVSCHIIDTQCVRLWHNVRLQLCVFNDISVPDIQPQSLTQPVVSFQHSSSHHTDSLPSFPSPSALSWILGLNISHLLLQNVSSKSSPIGDFGSWNPLLAKQYQLWVTCKVPHNPTWHKEIT